MNTSNVASPTEAPGADEHARLTCILRDALIVIALMCLAGPPIRGFTAANLLLGAIGFIISGSLAGGNRWAQLVYVALAIWVAGFMNVLFFDLEPFRRFICIVPLLAMVAFGGAVSYIFRRYGEIRV